MQKFQNKDAAIVIGYRFLETPNQILKTKSIRVAIWWVFRETL
jgi:hypothetical protein